LVTEAHASNTERNPPRVCALYIYPLKGARGIALERADVLAAGLRHDRRFMAIGEKGTFLTQREHPKMALIETTIDGDHLVLSVGDSHARVLLAGPGRERRVTVWKDEVSAIDVGGDGAKLLSEHLGERCSLVRMPPSTIRQVDLEFARGGDHVGFADGFPVLIANLASLADLNAKLEAPVGIERFRPNVVVEGAVAWEEETATHAQIGNVVFRTPKKCARCVVITIDQRTAETSKEPLKTLAVYRREGNKANFAMNAIPEAAGELRIGDSVTFRA
jgi:uncharacterized protein YcbX